MRKSSKKTSLGFFQNDDLFYLAVIAYLVTLIFNILINFVTVTGGNFKSEQFITPNDYQLSADVLGVNQVKFNWAPVAHRGVRLVVTTQDQKDVLNLSVDDMSSYIWTNGGGNNYLALLWHNRAISNPVTVSFDNLSYTSYTPTIIPAKF